MHPALIAALSVLTFLGAAIGMEFVARFMHKYVMHGTGWCLHYDHHNKSGRKFQKNDLYALFFAGTSFVLIYFGMRIKIMPMWTAGFGVALYGVGYVLFHDIMYHGRIRWLKLKPKHPYLKRIINSHRLHHATVMQGGAINYSFLWASRKFSPENQAEVDRMLSQIRDYQMELKRRSRQDSVGTKTS